ncbi:MAG: retropepsin-like aspartic protease/reverse transcriptase, partial [Candidatus Saccharimonadales bacterium]
MDAALLFQLLTQQMQVTQQVLAQQQAFTPANMAAARIPQRMIGSLEKFTGKQDVDAWLSQFENLMRVNAWDDAMAAQHFSLQLSSEVFAWYEPLNDDTKQSYRALSTTFRRHYGASSSPLVCQQQLKSRHLQSGESVESFAAAIRFLCHRVNPTMTEVEKIGYYLAGLPTDLKNFVYCSMPATLEAAVQSAKLRSSMGQFNPGTIQHSSAPSSVSAIDSITLADVREVVQAAIQEALGIQSRQQPQYSTSNNPRYSWQADNASVNSGNNFRGDRFQRGDRSHQRTWDGKPICDYCHKVGHHALVCRSRARDIAVSNGTYASLPPKQAIPEARRGSEMMTDPFTRNATHGAGAMSKKNLPHGTRNVKPPFRQREPTVSTIPASIPEDESSSENASIGIGNNHKAEQVAIPSMKRVFISETAVNSVEKLENLEFFSEELILRTSPLASSNNAVTSCNPPENAPLSSLAPLKEIPQSPTSNTTKIYKSAIAEGWINGIATSIVIDTGSAATIVSRKFYDDYLSAAPLEPSTRSAIVLADNRRMVVCGSCQVRIRLADCEISHDVLIVEGFRFAALIGNDALESFGLDVSYSKSQIITRTGGITPLEIAVLSKPPKSFPIHAIEARTIPEYSEVILRGEVQDRDRYLWLPACGMVSTSQGITSDLAILAARSIVQIERDRTVVLKICNPTTAPLSLSRGSCIAEFIAIDPSEIEEMPPAFHLVPECQDPSIGSSVTAIEKSDMCQPTRPLDPATLEWVKTMDLQGTRLSEAQQEKLRSLLIQNVDVFATSPEYMSAVTAVKHTIDTGHHGPIKLRPYRVSRSEEEAQAKEIQSQLDSGIIQPSSSPWAFPVVMVKKRDGSFRFCVDYRKLNQVTKKDVYPLPHINDTLDSLGGAQFFTTLDMITGYWQVELSEEDREKTAFITKLGLFEYLRMPFGLTNAPATFQRLVDFLLRGMHWVNALDYLDDIIIYTKTFEEHLIALDALFKRMRDIGLTAKISKCHFCEASLKFLGHVVSREGVSVDADKIKAVTSMRVPQDVHAVRRFLGLTTYYRRFIRSYAQVAEPLFRLLEKTTIYLWTEECQCAFEALKRYLVSSPILRYPDFKQRFFLHTDASGYALGAILSQRDGKEEYVISYASRTL